jgi:hypothetical protein
LGGNGVIREERVNRRNEMKILKEKDVTFKLDVDFEDMEIRGNAIVSGDDDLDKKIEDELIERVNHDDVWAWASVKVTAEWEGFEGVDYLGGCSYKDQEEFEQQGGYYQDMKLQALEDLNNNLKSINKRMEVLK